MQQETGEADLRSKRWKVTGWCVGSAVLFTAAQWVMFSANSLFGVLGVPVMVIWCLVAHLTAVPIRTHAMVTMTLGAFASYLPMLATCFCIKLWPG